MIMKLIQTNVNEKLAGTSSASQSNGFVLIEILIGLAILGIAMISSMRAISNAADTQIAITQRSLALLSADNYLTDIRINRLWPEIGLITYPCPQLNHAFICQDRVLSTPNPLFRRIEIAVYQSNPTNPLIAYGPKLAWLTTVVPNWSSQLL
jgi:general secretion pathway protein I